MNPICESKLAGLVDKQPWQLNPGVRSSPAVLLHQHLSYQRSVMDMIATIDMTDTRDIVFAGGLQG